MPREDLDVSEHNSRLVQEVNLLRSQMNAMGRNVMPSSSSHDDILFRYRSRLVLLEKEISDKNDLISSLESDIRRLSKGKVSELAAGDPIISSKVLLLEGSNEELTRSLNQSNSELGVLKSEVGRMSALLAQRSNDDLDTHKKLADQQRRINMLTEALAQKESEVSDVANRLARMSHEKDRLLSVEPEVFSLRGLRDDVARFRHDNELLERDLVAERSRRRVCERDLEASQLELSKEVNLRKDVESRLRLANSNVGEKHVIRRELDASLLSLSRAESDLQDEKRQHEKTKVLLMKSSVQLRDMLKEINGALYRFAEFIQKISQRDHTSEDLLEDLPSLSATNENIRSLIVSPERGIAKYPEHSEEFLPSLQVVEEAVTSLIHLYFAQKKAFYQHGKDISQLQVINQRKQNEVNTCAADSYRLLSEVSTLEIKVKDAEGDLRSTSDRLNYLRSLTIDRMKLLCSHGLFQSSLSAEPANWEGLMQAIGQLTDPDFEDKDSTWRLLWDMLMNGFSTLISQKKELNILNESLETQNKNALREMSALRSRFEDHIARQTHLNDETAMSTSIQHEREIDKLQKALRAAREAPLEESSREVAAANTTLRILKDMYNDLKTQNDELQKRFLEIQVRLKEKERDIGITTESVRECQSQLEVSNEDRQFLSNVVEKLKCEQEDTISTIGDLQRCIEDNQRKISCLSAERNAMSKFGRNIAESLGFVKEVIATRCSQDQNCRIKFRSVSSIRVPFFVLVAVQRLMKKPKMRDPPGNRSFSGPPALVQPFGAPTLLSPSGESGSSTCTTFTIYKQLSPKYSALCIESMFTCLGQSQLGVAESSRQEARALLSQNQSLHFEIHELMEHLARSQAAKDVLESKVRSGDLVESTALQAALDEAERLRALSVLESQTRFKLEGQLQQLRSREIHLLGSQTALHNEARSMSAEISRLNDLKEDSLVGSGPKSVSSSSDDELETPPVSTIYSVADRDNLFKMIATIDSRIQRALQ